MKNRVTYLIWVVSIIVFITSVWLMGADLPGRVATHFGPGGRADGWTSRETHLWQFMICGLGVSSFVIAICYSIRFFPASTLNVPHADYWRLPENYRRACAFLFTASFWYAALLLLWMSGLHYLTVLANRVQPPALNSGGLGLLTAALLTGSVVWVIIIVRYFSKTRV